MKMRILRLQSIAMVVLIGATAGSAAIDGPTQPVGKSGTSSEIAANIRPLQSKSLTVSDLGSGQKPAPNRLSPWSAQVAKLVQAGVDESVVFSYIDSAGTFNLTADQIIGMAESDVPRDVIAAMIQHDADVQSGLRQVLPLPVPSSDDDTLAAMLPPRKVAASTTTAISSAQPAPAGGGLATSAELPTEYILAPLEETYVPAEMQERSPVRKPYAVQLTAPILVWPTAGRIPNIVLVQPFP